MDLQDDPRPRGYDRVGGREDQFRIWVGRDHRVLYEIDEEAGRIIIVGVRRKDESTYKERFNFPKPQLRELQAGHGSSLI